VSYESDKMNFRIILFFLLITSGSMAFAQPARVADREIGHPLSRTYLPVEYNAHAQNFAVTQDSSGVMYFGNFAGVLEYDGASWNTIQTDNVTRVLALALDKRGRVLVGANGEFGYLAHDTLGVHRFVSLSNKIKSRIGSILQIVPTEKGALFISDQQIYIWNGSKIRVQRNDFLIQSAFAFKDKVLIFSKSRGLLLLNGESVTEVAKASGVPPIMDLISVVPQPDGSVLMLTTSQGMFRFSGNQVENITGNINQELLRNKATFATNLKDGSVAVSMMSGGLQVISPDGNILYPIKSESAVQDSQVSFLFSDRDNNLWLALNDGIVKINVSSPISKFDDDNGLKGEITAITRFQGKVFVGTLYGLFYIENNAVVRVPGFSGSCLAFQQSGNTLLIATNKGLAAWQNGGTSYLTNDFTLNVTVPASNPDVAYVSLQEGAGVLKKGSSGWSFQRFKNVNEQIVGVTEFPKGTLWLETLSNGVIKLNSQTGEARRFSTEKGITSPLYNKFSIYNTRLFVSNKDGLFEYVPARDMFVRTQILGTKNIWFDTVREDERGDIWATRGDKKGIAVFRKKAGKGAFEKFEVPFLPIAEVPMQVIYPDQNQVTWVGGGQGLYRLDMKVKRKYSYRYPVLIRKISVGDSSIAVKSAKDSAVVTQLTYKQNSISLEFALPSYHINQNVQYQYFLENYDKGWSEWSPLTRKEYSGLPFGRYIFRVRAKDVYNNVSREAVFAFTILTPWFLQWYLILLYAVLIGVIIYYGVRWRLRRILKEKQGLENLIRERTEEVVIQKEELELQSEELSATNDQLERIDDFVKSINSEVNTAKLFQMGLDRLCQFQNVDSASGLVYNKVKQNYQFIALSGKVDIASVENIELTYDQIAQRYIDNAAEVFEDIFVKNDFKYENLNNSIDDLFAPKSLISIIIRVEGQVRSIITLENNDHAFAFDQRDFNMMRNLKEHLIGAYIKTNILENLEDTLANLKSTQEALIRQEKLASVGQLTKGIVDRILNPLNYINNFSQSSKSLLSEISEVTDKYQDAFTEDDQDDLGSGVQMLKKNLEKIYEHGASTTRIVKDMQKLLKGKSNDFLVTELNPFLETKARYALQEVMNEYKGSNVQLTFDLSQVSVRVSLLPYEFSEVIHNLINNACYAVLEKEKLVKNYVPEVSVKSSRAKDGVVIKFRDNGKGIPQKEIEQIFSPFFTTKPTSKGTGLGLYMSKDIVEYHRGKMSISSKDGEFTEIEIFLPIVN
jgi:signal transduction histidine kinase/ligand-binding sensor domain-containing protein